MATPDPAPGLRRPHRAFRADLPGDAARCGGSIHEWLRQPWRSGECAAWLFIAAAMGTVYAPLAVVALNPLLFPSAGVLVLASLTGAVCGVVLSPVMALGAWRRSLWASAAIQLVGGSGGAVLPGLLGWTWHYPLEPILSTMTANCFAALACRVALPRRPLAGTLTGICHRCGYSRAGLPSPTCPECGHEPEPTPP